MKPIHQHDCDRCTYVGSDTQKQDWYVCSFNRGKSGTVICRYSSEPSENNSYSISFIRKSDFLINQSGDPYTLYINNDCVMAKYVLEKFMKNWPTEAPAPDVTQRMCVLPAGTHHTHFFDDRGRFIGSFTPRG